MNPYRTGVLIGNHVEDRYGSDLAAQEVSYIFKISIFLLNFQIFLNPFIKNLETSKNWNNRTLSKIP